MVAYLKSTFITLISITTIVTLTGCTISNNSNLEKRLRYEIEKDIIEKFGTENSIKITGSEKNGSIKIVGKNTGFIGSAVHHTFDIGDTFNQKIEQASNIISKNCKSDCEHIFLSLEDPKITYNFRTLGILEKSNFTFKIQANFNEKCKIKSPISLTYSKTVEYEKNHVFNTNYEGYIIPIELAIIDVVTEIRNIFINECS